MEKKSVTNVTRAQCLACLALGRQEVRLPLLSRKSINLVKVGLTDLILLFRYLGKEAWCRMQILSKLIGTVL